MNAARPLHSDPKEIFGRRWSPLEDQLLEASYGNTPARTLAARLGRSVMAVQMRASLRGLAVHSHWSAEEDAKLGRLWIDLEHDEHLYEAIAKVLERPAIAVHRRARDLGLPLGIPQGYVSLAEAARVCGMTPPSLLRLLGRAYVTVHSIPSEPGTKVRRFPKRYLLLDDATDAVKAWTLESETVNAAAERRGVGVEWLRVRLNALGCARSRPKPGEPQRVPTTMVDLAVTLLSGAQVARLYRFRLVRVCEVLGRADCRRLRRQFLVTPAEALAALVEAGLLAADGTRIDKPRRRRPRPRRPETVLRGARVGTAKLTDDLVRAIRASRGTPGWAKTWVDLLDIGLRAVHAAGSGRTWRHVQ